MTLELTRRRFVVGAGTLAVAFHLAPLDAVAAMVAADGLRIDESADDGSLAWLLEEDRVTIHSGKVELGTGVQTALTQIVLDELHLRHGRVGYVQGDTRVTPDQGTTAGSKTVQNGGPQLRQAAATAFQALLGLGRVC
jgi:nicotinate dehydrogenase subunit B